MMLLKNQFKSKRTGLDAMIDEVDEMVQRNTMELRKDVEELFEQSALELKEEIKSLLRIAHRKRKRLQARQDRAAAIEALGSSASLPAVSRSQSLARGHEDLLGGSIRQGSSAPAPAPVPDVAEPAAPGLSTPLRPLVDAAAGNRTGSASPLANETSSRSLFAPTGATAPRSDSPPDAKHTAAVRADC
jgi:hypothetical protein